MTKNKNDRTQAHKDFDVQMGKWLRKTRLAESYINPLTKRTIITTQSKLAKKLGVSFQQVQKYEKGLNVIGLFKFKEICVFFNKCPKDVLETVDVEIWKKDEEPLLTKVSSHEALASGGYNEAIKKKLKEQNVEKN